jgi:quinol-cytochrome oxidoreductase complex cytochrome b subunit
MTAPIDTPISPPEPTTAPLRPSRRRQFLDAVDDRLGIRAVQYPVPEHANNLGWSLGGVTAAALAVLVVTGILLAQWYNPVPEEANDSVRYIVQHVFLGGFLRNVHFWAAQAMFVLVILHLLRVFLTASYKRPREANWLVGVTMFALVIGAIFTGTVLKWDQEGFEALGHNLEIGKLLGGLGFWFTPKLASDVSILTRLYVAHIAIIPGLLLGLFALHGMLVKRHGISPHPRLDAAGVTPGEPTEPFTHHLRRIAAFGLILLGLLGLLAIFFPRGVGPNAVEGIEVTKPPWMFWWLFTLENWVGLKGILYGTGALFAVLAAVPFIDRNPERRWRRRPVAMAGLIAAVLLLVALTALMAATTPAEHLG